jgi:hypothetical protein
MNVYRYIVISGRVTTFDELLSREYCDGVAREAQLAKAAPDLLAALRAFEAFAAKQEWDELHPEQNRPKLLAQARAAIARATEGEV